MNKHHMITNVIKRSGEEVPFASQNIIRAVTRAYQETAGQENLPWGLIVRIEGIAELVAASLPATVGVEEIQDAVERAIAAAGDFDVARKYILYRESQRHKRVVTLTDGDMEYPAFVTLLDRFFAHSTLNRDDEFAHDVRSSLTRTSDYDELLDAVIMQARTRVERHPSFQYVAAAALLERMYGESLRASRLSLSDSEASIHAWLSQRLLSVMNEGVKANLYDPRMADESLFDFERLANALDFRRDRLFKFQGLQILYDRYLAHIDGRRIETPQVFWMRVAMGLSLNEDNPTQRAIQFYDVLSTFRMSTSTPTLFYSGATRSQMASCFVLTVEDSLDHIMDVTKDAAMLAKWAGGLGIDYTNVRSVNAHIKGVNGDSSGLIPFLNILNSVVGAVQQGGRRRSSAAVYLETWHAEMDEFLELRKNVGDERRRTHDLNTANWIPDLFMQRVDTDGDWWLFSPSDVPDLHDLYGQAFAKRYEHYEAIAETGVFATAKKIKAVDLWRRMLSMLYETGHPWITFKDPSNVRSPQSHTGVIHSSNLCTEVLLNTSAEETAVCNLASINLPTHITADGVLDDAMLEETVTTAIRMLDNVIDLNFYATEEAREANTLHRPIGLGVMGFQDALYALGISYASKAAVTFADTSMERISYYAISASAWLASERGPYATYYGSKWDQGYLPIDTIDLLQAERGTPVEQDRTEHLKWLQVRELINDFGMRNSNVMAIAPTATISNIQGVSQSIEPTFANIFVKSNLSGKFTVVNEALVYDLMDLGIWDDDMVAELKRHDGSIAAIERIPLDVRKKYPTAFEIDYGWLIEAASRRQKWIDQGQSLNLYNVAPSGRQLSDMYMLAWKKGLKTTYYLRTRGATSAEKSTVASQRFGVQAAWKSIDPQSVLRALDVPPAKVGIMESANRSGSYEWSSKPRLVNDDATLTSRGPEKINFPLIEPELMTDDLEDMICESCT